MSDRHSEQQLPMPTALLDADEAFLKQLYSDVQAEGLECDSLGVVMELADSGEFGVVADLLGRMAEDGHSDWAAAVVTKLVEQSKAQGGVKSNYSVVALLLGQLVDEQRAEAVSDIVVHLLKSRDKGDVSVAALALGQMLQFHRTDWTNNIIACASYPETQPGGGLTQLDALSKLLSELIAQDQLKWAATMTLQLANNNRSDVFKRVARGTLSHSGHKGLTSLCGEIQKLPSAQGIAPMLQEVMAVAPTNGISNAPASKQTGVPCSTG